MSINEENYPDSVATIKLRANIWASSTSLYLNHQIFDIITQGRCFDQTSVYLKPVVCSTIGMLEEKGCLKVIYISYDGCPLEKLQGLRRMPY